MGVGGEEDWKTIELNLARGLWLGSLCPTRLSPQHKSTKIKVMERVYLFPGEYDAWVYRPMEPVVELNFADLYPSVMQEATKAPIPRSSKPDKRIDQD